MWTSRRSRRRQARGGGVLLAVLWLSAALAAIAFSVAASVRSELDRSATLSDTIRARYLARAGVDRGILNLLARTGRPVPSREQWAFPSGVAVVEIIPEQSRLSLNTGRADQFVALLLALGAPPERAQEIATGILDWRTPGSRVFDSYYLSLQPSFLPRHASFQEEEEVLYVRGMTPELFHGSYTRDQLGRLVRLGAFKDCVSVYGAVGTINLSFAEPALMRAFGMAPDLVEQAVASRRAAPPVIRHGADPHTIYTVRSTARVGMPNGGLSEVSSTVSARVKFRRMEVVGPPAFQVLRWYEPAESEVAQWR